MVDEIFKEVTDDSILKGIITFLKEEIIGLITDDGHSSGNVFGTQSLIDSAIFLENILEQAKTQVDKDSDSDQYNHILEFFDFIRFSKSLIVDSLGNAKSSN